MSLGGVALVAIVIVATVFVVRPLLPSLVMPPGRLTPFATWTAGLANGAVFAWACGPGAIVPWLRSHSRHS